MKAKLLAIVCGLVFWQLGLLAVVSWHAQQDHQDPRHVYLKPIDVTISFVDIAD